MNKESRDYFLLKKIKEKDQNAFNEFYLKNEPLVYSLLKKYVHKTKDYEELVMCAKYGLVLAIYNFDLSYDTMFSTYAVPLILGEIKKYFNDKVYKNVIPRNVKLSEAPSYGMPITIYDPRSKGAKSYDKFTKEFLKINNKEEE